MKIRKDPTPRNGSLFPHHYDYERPGKLSDFSRLKENKLATSPMTIQGFAMDQDHRKILARISLGHVKTGREKI